MDCVGCDVPVVPSDHSIVAAMVSEGSEKHLNTVNSMSTSELKGSKISRLNLQQT